jgi:hypothetical protein
MMTKNLSLLLLCTLAAAACGKKDSISGSEAAPKTAAGSAPAAAAAPAAAPAALADIDLGKAGAAWQGFHIKGPAVTDIGDSGSGDVVINFTDNTMVHIAPLETLKMKDFKEREAQFAKSVTYSIDTPDEIMFKTVENMGGQDVVSYGFTTISTVGGKKVSCSASFDNEEIVKRLETICRSLAKG